MAERRRRDGLLQDFLHELSAPGPSQLSRHPAACCMMAERWFSMMARSHSSIAQSLSFIGERWSWGPLQWPLYWCRLSVQDRLDCGAHAALGRAACAAKNLPTISVQMLLRYDTSTTRNWARIWELAGVEPNWLRGPFAYHEALALPQLDGLRIWDVTDGREVEPIGDGYGSVAAVRLLPGGAVAHPTRWGRYELHPDRWSVLSGDA